MIASFSLMPAWMPNTFCRSNKASANVSVRYSAKPQRLTPRPATLQMLRRIPSRVLAFGLLLFIAAANTNPALANTNSDAGKAINVQADQSDFDEKAGIQSLKGNVEITQGSLKVKADSIQIELKDGALFRIVGKGNPIRFQQQTDTGAIMKGQSNRIEYNMQTTQITFTGDAKFERPGQKLSGSSIMYNMSDLTFKASGDKKGRVNIVLQPTQIKR